MNKNSIAELRLGIMQNMLQTLNEMEQADKPAKSHKPKAAPQPEKPKENAAKRKREHKNGIRVRDARALYALADREMLHTIYAIVGDKDFPGAKIYMVNDTPITREILAPFMPELAQPKEERNE